MLVTLPVYSKEEDNSKGVLHLWLTDNTHIVDIGPVSGEGDDVAASSLLYKSGNNNELIALYEKKKGGGATPGMVSVRLTEQLQRVKDVLTTWKEVDKRVSKLCLTSIAAVSKSTGNACATFKITDGLVGFLSGEFSGNTWRDEYLGVNATVKKEDGAEKKDNGVTFKGRGAWAEWPVGSQGENQLYHFANYNFTLVATVSIDGVPKEGSIPLMGVRLDGGKNLWSCCTTAKASGGCCAVTEQPRGLKAPGIQRHSTKWPLCYRTENKAPCTSMVSVCVGVRNVDWRQLNRKRSPTSTLEGMEAAQGAKETSL
ncbi:trans-sialidase, putative [Trypanosoma cruzi]|nr:trans-sialidase, putative [Trypanosoma cruzi]